MSFDGLPVTTTVRDGENTRTLPNCKSMTTRRGLWRGSKLGAATVAALAVLPASHPAVAAATPDRQLELCLVSVARVVYWAQSAAQSLSGQQQQQEDPEIEKQAYLQARLGAKAILTGRVGGGATGRVYTLSTLQIPGCLKDMQVYSNAISRKAGQQFREFKTEWTEALAAVVEFDGLETLTDPSPRSLLTLQQYNPTKAVFVRRLLVERVVPLGRQLLQSFPEDARKRSRDYSLQYYANEMVLNEPPVL